MYRPKVHLPNKNIRSTLQALGDIGLGGERSSGHGLYDIGEPDTLHDLDQLIQDVPNSDLFTTLSHYHPQKDEAYSDPRRVFSL